MYWHAINVCISILYPPILLNYFINFNSLPISRFSCEGMVIRLSSLTIFLNISDCNNIEKFGFISVLGGSVAES